MDDWRMERIARNEVRFREINERLNEDMRQVPGNPELLEFICECGDPDCAQHVQLTTAEFEQVRLDSRRFFILPGHAIPEAERIVTSNERYEVVEKLGDAIELADAEDPRAPGEAGRRDD